MSENRPIDGQSVVEGLTQQVATWPDVTVGEHRFGGVEFRVGRRELGHVHPLAAGASFADLPFPRAVRDEFIEAGRARRHHALPDSGWLTVPIRTAADLREAVEIFRMNYDRARPSKRAG